MLPPFLQLDASIGPLPATDWLTDLFFQRLQHIEDEARRKEEEQRMAELETRHRQHGKVNHPMTKDQLEGVWEEQVSLGCVFEMSA